MSGTALADRVDELAKCNAAYSIMTSLEGYNAQLGEHFTREASFLFDLTGLYGQLDRGRSMTNGEKMELWTSHLRRLDDEASNGAALKPHFFACAGWRVAFQQYMQSIEGRPTEDQMIAAPSPSLGYDWPFDTKQQASELFDTAYQAWSEMGKVAPDTVRDLLNDLLNAD